MSNKLIRSGLLALFLGCATLVWVDSVRASDVEEAKLALKDDTSRVSSERNRPISYGSNKLYFGVSRPSFEKLPYYDDLYGSPGLEFKGGANYYFLRKYIALGLGFRMGFYSDSGNAATTRTPVEEGTLRPDEKDSQSEIELKLFPVQGIVSLQMSPFNKKWVLLDLWGGVEQLYIQESKHSRSGGGDNPEGRSATYVNQGWNQNTLVGGSIGFRIDPLDPSSALNLEFLGLGPIYLDLFYEVIKTRTNKLIAFDRKVIGLLFTFESIN